MRRYSVIVEPDSDEDSFIVSVPALPGCYTYGHSIEQALERVQEAIAAYIGALELEGLPIPTEKSAPLLTAVNVA